MFRILSLIIIAGKRRAERVALHKRANVEIGAFRVANTLKRRIDARRLLEDEKNVAMKAAFGRRSGASIAGERLAVGEPIAGHIYDQPMQP